MKPTGIRTSKDSPQFVGEIHLRRSLGKTRLEFFRPAVLQDAIVICCNSTSAPQKSIKSMCGYMSIYTCTLTHAHVCVCVFELVKNTTCTAKCSKRTKTPRPKIDHHFYLKIFLHFWHLGSITCVTLNLFPLTHSMTFFPGSHDE